MAKGKSTRKLKVTLPPLGGDHGTGTMAAIDGTEVVPIDGDNPNNMGMRKRREIIELAKVGLSCRQHQAAREIRDAHCEVEKLSSGGPISERVDHTADPSAIATRHVEVTI